MGVPERGLRVAFTSLAAGGGGCFALALDFAGAAPGSAHTTLTLGPWHLRDLQMLPHVPERKGGVVTKLSVALPAM